VSTDRRPAGLGRRVGAYLIDGAIAVVVTLAAAGLFAGVSFATQGGFPLAVAIVLAYVLALAWFAFYTWMQGGGGSIGMRMMGLQLVHAADDKPLGFGRALGRNVVWGLACSVVVGYFSTLFDDSPWRRGWHDKAAGALMTDIAGHGPVAPEPAAGASGDAGAGIGAGASASAGPSGADRSVFPTAPPLPPLPVSMPVVPEPAPAEETVIAQARTSAQVQASAPAADATAHATTSAQPGVISFVPGVTGPPTAARPASPVATPAAPARVARAPLPSALDDLPPAFDETRLAARPLVRLAWDDGARQAVYGRTLFGRNPAAEHGATVSAVRDETLSLSKTHFEITLSEGVAWVIDRHSTNGVVIKRGAGRQSAQPGEPVRLRAGDILEFGDRHVMVEVAP